MRAKVRAIEAEMLALMRLSKLNAMAAQIDAGEFAARIVSELTRMSGV